MPSDDHGSIWNDRDQFDLTAAARRLAAQDDQARHFPAIPFIDLPTGRVYTPQTQTKFMGCRLVLAADQGVTSSTDLIWRDPASGSSTPYTYDTSSFWGGTGSAKINIAQAGHYHIGASVLWDDIVPLPLPRTFTAIQIYLSLPGSPPLADTRTLPTDAPGFNVTTYSQTASGDFYTLGGPLVVSAQISSDGPSAVVAEAILTLTLLG
jgi:hypothetical protein